MKLKPTLQKRVINQYKIKQKIGVTKKVASHFSHMASCRIYQKVDIFVDRLSYTPISIHKKTQIIAKISHHPRNSWNFRAHCIQWSWISIRPRWIASSIFRGSPSIMIFHQLHRFSWWVLVKDAILILFVWIAHNLFVDWSVSQNLGFSSAELEWLLWEAIVRCYFIGKFRRMFFFF